MDISSFIFGMLFGAAVCLVVLRAWVINALEEARNSYKRAIAVNEHTSVFYDALREIHKEIHTTLSKSGGRVNG